jgi:NTP pyrophosphatase (non-canonical NTP hydrolase)
MRTKSSLFLNYDKVLTDLHAAAGTAMFLGDIADNIKRAMFYGKNYVDPDTVEFDPAVAEALEKGEVYNLADHVDLVHGILGLFTEACELMELLQGLMATSRIDRDKVINELGDTGWYRALIATAVNTTLAEVDAKNIAKLTARYPEKFTAEAAENRDESKESHAMRAVG